MGSKIASLFLVTGIISFVNPIGEKIGPYDVKLEKLEQCEDQGSGKIAISTRITHGGRGKYYYNENFTLQVPGDENVTVHVEAQKWGNGGWRPKSFQYTVKGCKDMMGKIGHHIKSIMKSAGREEVDHCPIPVGVYKVENWLIEVDVQKIVPVMEYGKYRGIYLFFYDQEFIGCLMGVIEVVPKASG